MEKNLTLREFNELLNVIDESQFEDDVLNASLLDSIQENFPELDVCVTIREESKDEIYITSITLTGDPNLLGIISRCLNTFPSMFRHSFDGERLLIYE